MQSTNNILMIEPVAFGYNSQTAVNNYFQVNTESEQSQTKALSEFSVFVKKLRSKKVTVITIKDSEEPHTPDSIFPNNWVSFHDDGTVILYPLFAVNRRLERREDILEKLKTEGFRINKIKDYSCYETENKFLEGTGSMILDRENKIAYGAVSLRLNEIIFNKWCKDFGYKPVIFHTFQSVNGKRLPIYHTNVMMCIGSDYVVICFDAIDDTKERLSVEASLKESCKEIIPISEEQLKCFAGNMLEVKNNNGKKFLVMSESAYKSLTSKQIQTIETHAEIIHSNLQTIEQNGGGSARCMMAEIFLPSK